MCVSRDTDGIITRRITGNFNAARGLWVQRLLAKIRLFVGGKISCMERIYGSEARVELSTKVRLARRGPPRNLLSYCIVSTTRCAVLEQVFSPSPLRVLLSFTPAPFLLCHPCFLLSATSALPFLRATRPLTLRVLCQRSPRCRPVPHTS